MSALPKRDTHGGFSLVEVVVVAALSVLVFGSLFSSFQYTLGLVNESRAKLSALSVANDRMEFLRSLPYDDVGTIAGIPSGPVPQTSTTSLNGIEFQERVLIEFYDDDAEGTGAADSNLIPNDYKRVKLEYTWEIGGATSSIMMVSNIVPRSVETNLGGGTVRINVIDADSNLLAGADVLLENDTTTSTISLSRTTDASGSALISGAPAASDYEVTVTANIGGDAYSTDQTYEATPSNPNPVVAPFSVLEGDVSTLTFQIGELSDLTVGTYSSFTDGFYEDTFSNLTGVASSSAVEATGGFLQLSESLGVYETSGVAFLDIAPATLVEWQAARVGVDIPVNTSHRVQFYTGTSTTGYTLIPESELTGNTAGFSETVIDLTELDPLAYPAIVAGIHLETTNTSVSPEIKEFHLAYRESETPRTGLTYDIRGAKIIGTDSSSQPIYKYAETRSTDGVGEDDIADLEFDSYTVTPPGSYDLARACPGHPFSHQAGIDGNLDLELVPNAADTLRVTVVDTLGRSVPGADVRLSRSGYDVTQLTGGCGQTFFTGGVANAADYDLEVSAQGYVTESIANVTVNGDSELSVTIANI
jgi:hypothetical protein